MRELMPLAEKAAALLKARQQTIAIAESSAGGLIAAALLAVPGASAYFRGGAVLYTRAGWRALRDYKDDDFAGTTPSTEPNALLRARLIRNQFGADWGIGETGAAGPTGGRYGNPAGLACVAIAGPLERAITVNTHAADRYSNMFAFAAGALELLADSLQ